MKRQIKKILSKNDFVYKLSKNAYHYFRKRLYNFVQGNRHWKFDLLDAYVTYKKNVTFVQIGSNNGVNGDPIHDYIKKYRWRGILVEPIPYIFKELEANYQAFKDVLFFENSAIASENGILKFYRLKKSDLPNLPRWYDQLGSFNKEVVMKHRDSIPCFDELFIEDSVNAITFSELLKKYSIKDLNLIHIDTEGYDYEILKMIPFPDFNIDFLMFEHKHLSISDYKKAKTMLRKNGYQCGIIHEVDTVAIKKYLLPILTAVNKRS